MKKNVFAALLLMFVCFTAAAQQGILKGTVTDAKTGEELVGAAIVVDGTTMGTITNFMGEYEMPPLEPGTYAIKVQYVSYESQTHQGVVIAAGQETILDFKLGSADMDLEEVQVVAKANRESENYLMMEQKKATVIKESIGAKRMSSLGVSDAAGATSKISGVTQSEESGDVYIRGLGDRYLSTTMNGLPIPSDDVEKKNIDLKMFSTDVIRNIGISKTYAVEGYADQASGVVDISSKTSSNKISIGLSGGTNTNVLSDGVFSNFRATQNINDQTLGFYSAPYSTSDAISNQSWNTESRSLPIKYGISLMGGGKFQLLGKNMNVFATVSQSSDSKYQTGEFRSYRSNVKNQEWNDVEQYTTEYNTTGLLNLTYDFNPKNTISFNTLYIHKTNDILYEAGRNAEGYVYDQLPLEDGAFIRDQNLKQTSLLTSQLLGTHTITDKNYLKWGVGYNSLKADEPNRIRNEVSIDEDAVYFARNASFQERKSFQEIDDSEINGYLKDEIRFVDEDKKKYNLSLGANFRRKSRDFASQFVGVAISDAANKVSSIDNMDEALNDQSLYDSEALELKERTLDTYNATLGIYAGFFNFGFQLDKFSGSIGARYEVDNIKVDWDVTNYVGRKGDSEKNYNNILPSLNLKYQLTEKSNMRLAVSKTLTLPEFKEIAPFEYNSPTGRIIKGNPDLKLSEVYNFDLKYEMFPSAGQLISATAFYKNINDPINKTMTTGSSGNFYYANTGVAAIVYGLELEARYDIIKSTSEGMPGLDFSFNATRMWFKQDLLEKFQYDNVTESGLEGASEFIFNGSLTYNNNKPKQFMATVTGNYSSDKIYSLGSPESQADRATLYNSEIIEKGFVTLDLILSKKVSDRVALKFSGKNLLNPEIKQTQAIQPLSAEGYTAVVKSYKKGISLSLGVSIDLN